MDYIKQQYHHIRMYYEVNMKNIFPVTILLFVLTMSLTSIVISANPGLATKLLFQTSSLVDANVTIIGLLPTIVKYCSLSLCAIALGMLPFVYLSSLFSIMIGAMIGILFGSIPISSITYSMIFAHILPHGLISITTILFACSCGNYLCKCITLHITHKRRLESIKRLVFELLRIYVLVIVPLMILASLLQVFITPIFISLI